MTEPVLSFWTNPILCMINEIPWLELSQNPMLVSDEVWIWFKLYVVECHQDFFEIDSNDGFGIQSRLIHSRFIRFRIQRSKDGSSLRIIRSLLDSSCIMTTDHRKVFSHYYRTQNKFWSPWRLLIQNAAILVGECQKQRNLCLIDLQISDISQFLLQVFTVTYRSGGHRLLCFRHSIMWIHWSRRCGRWRSVSRFSISQHDRDFSL